MKKNLLLLTLILFSASCSTLAPNPAPIKTKPSSSPNSLIPDKINVSPSASPGASSVPSSPSPSPIPSSTIPEGFSMVAGGGANPISGFGNEVSMVLDENDEPLICYLNSTNNRRNVGLFFTRWDRNTNVWKTPLRIATIDIPKEQLGARQVSIARDPKTGTIGVAYQKTTEDINFDGDIYFIYSTDGGLNWSTEVKVGENRFGVDQDEASPSLELYNNQVHLAFFNGWVRCQSGQCHSLIYATKNLTDPTFNYTTSPLLPDSGQNNIQLSLALNDKGQAGIANYVDGLVNSNGVSVGPLRIVYWEPITGVLESVDSSTAPNDFRSISLKYYLNKPAIVYHMNKNPNVTQPYVWLATKENNTWTPLSMPYDPSKDGGNWLSLAYSTSGIPTVAYEVSVARGAGQCGMPLLATYRNAGWSMCAPEVTKLPLVYMDAYSGEYMNIAFNKSGKRIMVYKQTVPYPQAGLSVGVAMWKEQNTPSPLAKYGAIKQKG